jgi:RNA polymerase sigma-54 factor
MLLTFANRKTLHYYTHNFNIRAMLSQIQSQRQQLKIHPLQIHLLNLYFLNSLELQQRIKNEIEENPFLDTQDEKNNTECDTKSSKDDMQDFASSEENMYDDRADYVSEYQNYFDADNNVNSPIVNVCTFKEDAKQQLRLLHINKKEKAIADYLVDTLTSQGLMDRQVDEVADEMSFHLKCLIEPGAVKKGLKLLQSLEPIGLGVSCIQECLLVQLHNMPVKSTVILNAIMLLEHHYDELMLRQFEKLQHVLKINEGEMKCIFALIGSLNFYPVNETHQHDPKVTIIPDFILTTTNDVIKVSLCSGKSGNVFVNQTLYDQLADHVRANDKAAAQYVKSKLSGAQWFVNAVKQREETMMRIMTCIAELQQEYFITGDIRYLKPMVIRNVADKLGLDISSISRITSNKYIETPFGLIYLKKLFSEGIVDQSGEVVSNKVIQSVLSETIESENKKQPYTDQQLVQLLSLKGYNIARRTVSKYRYQMNVPIAQIRAVWA